MDLSINALYPVAITQKEKGKENKIIKEKKKRKKIPPKVCVCVCVQPSQSEQLGNAKLRRMKPQKKSNNVQP